MMIAVVSALYVTSVVVSLLFQIHNGIQAATLAMAGCVFAGLLSISVSGLERIASRPLMPLFLGMSIRMTSLLALVLFVYFRRPVLIETGGFVFFLFVFYVSDLVLETVCLVESTSTCKVS